MNLVSIVSSCYNGETYIRRYLDAIIAQTYRPLELILVNNGSTDRTDDIIQDYKKRLEDEHIAFKYINKANEGLGAAINDGIKETTGEYLIWPDTDDILFPESIERRVAFLEAHKEFGFVTTDGKTFLEDDLQNHINIIEANVPKDGNMFKNVITGNVVYTPCGYMLRTSAFLDVNPTKSIFPSWYGQNIQMLLPISYKYKCGYIKEPLYGRIDRKDSLSKKEWKESDDAWKRRVMGLEEIYVETLKSIGDEAVAYIPYIYYKDLRILNRLSRERNVNSHRKLRNTLVISMKMLFKEIVKSVYDLLRFR